MRDLDSLLEEGRYVEYGMMLNRRRKDYRVKEYLNRKFNEVEALAGKFFDLSPEERLKLAVILASKLVVDGASSSQIRRILGLSNSISRKIRLGKDGEDISADIVRMRYVLAYTASRHRDMMTLAKFCDEILRNVDAQNFETYHEFLQAVVAYHKLMGGKD